MLIGGSLLVSAAWGAGSTVVVEDWAKHEVGRKGVPAGWETYQTPLSTPTYDLTLVEDAQIGKVLHLKSQREHSNILKPIDVDLKATPILEWTWKVVTLPEGGDIRQKSKSDLAAHIYVVWKGTFRTELLGYAWDATVPAGQDVPSQKSSPIASIQYVVLRSGKAEVNTWKTEARNVVEDYRRVFQSNRDPGKPSAIVVSIDSNDTKSTAESFVGRIAFRGL
jgi:hypothetical protein